MNAQQLLGLFNFMILCVIGWRFFDRLRVPAASVLGGITFIGIANLLSIPLYLPAWLRFIMTVNLGISIGSKYNIRINRNLFQSVVLFIVVIVFGSVGILYLMEGMGMEKGTAIFASLLGGLTEMSFLAQEFAFDAFQVSVFQLSRMCVMLVFIPVIASKLPGTKMEQKPRAAKYPAPSQWDWAVLVAAAVLLVELLTLLKVPAGKMIGAAVSTAVYSSVRKIKPGLNPQWHSMMLSFIGGSTGMSVNAESIAALPGLIFPLGIYLLAVTLITILSYLLLRNVCGLDSRTAIFSSSMGGLAPSIAASEVMDADSSVVSTFQIIRYFSVIALALLLGYIF